MASHSTSASLSTAPYTSQQWIKDFTKLAQTYNYMVQPENVLELTFHKKAVPWDEVDEDPALDQYVISRGSMEGLSMPIRELFDRMKGDTRLGETVPIPSEQELTHVFTLSQQPNVLDPFFKGLKESSQVLSESYQHAFHSLADTVRDSFTAAIRSGTPFVQYSEAIDGQLANWRAHIDIRESFMDICHTLQARSFDLLDTLTSDENCYKLCGVDQTQRGPFEDSGPAHMLFTASGIAVASAELSRQANRVDWKEIIALLELKPKSDANEKPSASLKTLWKLLHPVTSSLRVPARDAVGEYCTTELVDEMMKHVEDHYQRSYKVLREMTEHAMKDNPLGLDLVTLSDYINYRDSNPEKEFPLTHMRQRNPTPSEAAETAAAELVAEMEESKVSAQRSSVASPRSKKGKGKNRKRA